MADNAPFGAYPRYATDASGNVTGLSAGGENIGTPLPVLADYATTIPLDANRYMAQHQIDGATTLTAGSTLTPGAQCTIALISDGVNIPTFSGFAKWGGSSAWDNTNGAVNEVAFFVLGTRAYYSISQASPLETYFETLFVQMSSLTSMTESGDASVGYSYTTSAISSQVAKGPNLSLAGDGYVEAGIQTGGASAAWVIGLDDNPSAITSYTHVLYGIYPSNTGYYKPLVNGSNTTPSGSATITVTADDKMRLTRSGTDVSFDIIRGETIHNLHTVTGVAAGTLSPVVTGVNLSGVIQGPISIHGGS